MNILSILTLMFPLILACEPPKEETTTAPSSESGTESQDNENDNDGSNSNSEDDTNANETSVTNDITMTGNLDLPVDAMVIAKGLDGSVHKARVAEDGSFSLGIDKDDNYKISIVTGSLAITDTELALVSTDEAEVYPLQVAEQGLESVPTQLVESEQTTIDIGNMSVEDEVASSEAFDDGSALEDLNLSESNAAFVGSNDDNGAIGGQLDLNTNGVLDFDEELFVSLSVSIQWRDDTMTNHSIESLRNQEADLSSIISNANLGYTFLTIKVAEAFKKDTATMTFPEMKICVEANNNEDCTSSHTSKTITIEEDSFTDTVPNGVNGAPAYQYGISKKDFVNGAENPFPRGDYTLALAGGETLTMKNIRPRNVTAADRITLPEVEVVEANGIVTKVNYVWKTRDPNATTWRPVSLEELALLFKGAGSSAGFIGFQLNDVAEAATCNIPIDKVSGVIDMTTCNLKDGFTSVPWTEVESISVSSRDAFEFQPSYFLIGPNF